jgi:hypothetical protein
VGRLRPPNRVMASPGEAAATLAAVAEVEAVRSGGVTLSRLLDHARSVLSSASRLLSRRCMKLVILLGVPTTLLAFLVRTFSSMQATRRRRALADVAERRRQEAQSNIAAVAADVPRDDSTKSAADRQEVVNLSFLELQKRLKDGKITAHVVLESYRAQAARAHARVNCLTEFLPSAIKVAQARSHPVAAVPCALPCALHVCVYWLLFSCSHVHLATQTCCRARIVPRVTPPADSSRPCVEQSVFRKKARRCMRLGGYSYGLDVPPYAGTRRASQIAEDSRPAAWHPY